MNRAKEKWELGAEMSKQTASVPVQLSLLDLLKMAKEIIKGEEEGGLDTVTREHLARSAELLQEYEDLEGEMANVPASKEALDDYQTQGAKRKELVDRITGHLRNGGEIAGLTAPKTRKPRAKKGSGPATLAKDSPLAIIKRESRAALGLPKNGRLSADHAERLKNEITRRAKEAGVALD